MRILSLISSVAIAALASAQAPAAPRAVTLVPDLRVEGRQMGGSRDFLFAIGAKGQLVASVRGGGTGVNIYDSTGAPWPWRLLTGRSDSSEIGFPRAVGWVGTTDTMWVSDELYRQVVLVDPNGKVLKSIENPSWIHPSWAERRKYPVFSRMMPYAVYPDRTMLVVPWRPRSLIDTPGYDRSRSRMIRMTWDGKITHTVAHLPRESRAVTLNSKACNHTIVVPFASPNHFTVSVDGMRIVIVEPGVSAADSGSVRVTMLTDRGDTVYSKRVTQLVERTSEKEVGRFLESIRACGQFTAEELRDSVKTRVPAFKSFATGVMIDRNYNTWVFARLLADTARQRSATVLNPRGEVVSVVSIPLNEIPLAVDGERYWALEPGKPRLSATFVRFKPGTTAAPPPRAGSAAGSSKPTRPPG